MPTDQMGSEKLEMSLHATSNRQLNFDLALAGLRRRCNDEPRAESHGPYIADKRLT